MSRQPDITTKSVATRIPMADYIKFLKEATSNSMSISDWLLVKIYDQKEGKEKSEIRKLKEELTTTRTENIALKTEQASESLNNQKRIAELQKELANAQNALKQLELELKKKDQIIQQQQDEIRQKVKIFRSNVIQDVRHEESKSGYVFSSKIDDILEKHIYEVFDM